MTAFGELGIAWSLRSAAHALTGVAQARSGEWECAGGATPQCVWTALLLYCLGSRVVVVLSGPGSTDLLPQPHWVDHTHAVTRLSTLDCHLTTS